MKELKWNFALVLLVLFFCFLFFSITKNFDYQWNWKKVPQYFITDNYEQTLSPVDGTIEKIEKFELVLREDNGQTHHVSLNGKVDGLGVGDFIYEGDTLSSFKSKKIGPLLQGLWVTIKISILSSILALFLGVITGLFRMSDNPILKYPSLWYIECIRGTPLLVQLFIIYFIVGTVVGIDSRMVCGVISLGLFGGAYAGEIIRSGIESIPKGQMEASRSLGLSNLQSMIHIIFPQTFKIVLPSLAGTFISLIKDSSLVSVMALTDLTKAGREIVSSSFMVFEIWIVVALLYFIVTFSLSVGVRRLEKKMGQGY